MSTYTSMGYHHGVSVGTWVIDENTPDDTVRRIVKGYNEGDPEIMDMAPYPLSGEWTGESLSELGLADADGDDLEDYAIGFTDGFWSEVIRSANARLENVE
jgi:hypothetical protein